MKHANFYKYFSVILVNACFIVPVHNAHALDRLFTSEQQREQLDELRYGQEPSAFNKESNQASSTQSTDLKKRNPPSSSLILNGVVSTKGKHPTVWLNGKPSKQNSNLVIEAGSSYKQVNVFLLNENKNIHLKPGQTIILNKKGGSVTSELLSNTPPVLTESSTHTN